MIVDFLEGDPDRPIIIGRVYNADQTTPYTLPDNQTQSGIRTRSSKEGSSDTYNEIMLEDKKGGELLRIHAEKDMDTSVEHDDTQLVENNRTITVKGTHTETITKDTTIEIEQGNYSMTIDQGNETRTLKMGNQTVELKMGNQSTTLDMGNQSTKCSLGAISMEAMQSITLKVGGSQIQITPVGVTIQGTIIQVKADAICQVNASGMLILKGGLTLIN